MFRAVLGHSKAEGKEQEISHVPPPPSLSSSLLTIQIPHQRGTFVTANELTFHCKFVITSSS